MLKLALACARYVYTLCVCLYCTRSWNRRINVTNLFLFIYLFYSFYCFVIRCKFLLCVSHLKAHKLDFSSTFPLLLLLYSSRKMDLLMFCCYWWRWWYCCCFCCGCLNCASTLYAPAHINTEILCTFQLCIRIKYNCSKETPALLITFVFFIKVFSFLGFDCMLIPCSSSNFTADSSPFLPSFPNSNVYFVFVSLRFTLQLDTSLSIFGSFFFSLYRLHSNCVHL